MLNSYTPGNPSYGEVATIGATPDFDYYPLK
jgi:hypothetical protein